MGTVRPDPKPRRRYVATVEEWLVLMRVVRSLQGDRCGCGCGRPIDSFHHLVNRSQGGDDVVSCLVGLYGDGTRGCHGALTSGNRVVFDGEAIDPHEIAWGIGRNLRPDQISYIRSRAGAWYLEKHYGRKG